MSLPSAGQELIAGFFEALQERNFATCNSLLGELGRRARHDTELRYWLAYLRGILAFEAHQRYDLAERLFGALVRQPELTDALRGRVLYALGRCYDIQGRWDDAITTFEAVVAAAEPIDRAKAWKHTAITICRGFNQGDLGPEQLQRAVVYCRQALDLLTPLAGDSPNLLWLTGSVWNTLGAAYMHQGRPAEALECYRCDLAICSELEDDYGMGVSYLNQGEIHHQRGAAGWPEALAAYTHALERIRAAGDPVLEADVLANLGMLYQDLGDPAVALANYTKAIELLESVRAGVASEEGRAGFFATVVDTYAHCVLLCLQIGNPVRAFGYVERARSRAFLDLLAADSPELAGQAGGTPLTLAEVQAALPEDSVLLEYFTTGQAAVVLRRATNSFQRHRMPPERTVLFAVRRTEVQAYDLGMSPNDLAPADMRNVVEQHFLHPDRLRMLYRRLIAPAAAQIADVRRMYIAPHGPLHYIPFQALIAPDGEPLLRDSGPAVLYAPSATFLFSRDRAARPEAALPCLALGYNGLEPYRLRFGEEEARTIAAQTNGAALTGVQPKKAALFRQAAEYRLLHLSCHGIFDADAPLDSGLLLAPDEYLTARDILAHLRLRCDLVTLSACESGLSRVRRGDELVGLMRAFMAAGTRALICTLWRVDEHSTRLLMERLYQEIAQGAPFAEALRRAQLYLRTLTAEQARSALIRIIAGDLLHHPPEYPTQPGRSLLRGAAAERELHPDLPQGSAETFPYADPFYWAPFIVIESQQ